MRRDWRRITRPFDRASGRVLDRIAAGERRRKLTAFGAALFINIVVLTLLSTFAKVRKRPTRRKRTTTSCCPRMPKSTRSHSSRSWRTTFSAHTVRQSASSTNQPCSIFGRAASGFPRRAVFSRHLQETMVWPSLLVYSNSAYLEKSYCQKLRLLKR